MGPGAPFGSTLHPAHSTQPATARPRRPRRPHLPPPAAAMAAAAAARPLRVRCRDACREPCREACRCRAALMRAISSCCSLRARARSGSAAAAGAASAKESFAGTGRSLCVPGSCGGRCRVGWYVRWCGGGSAEVMVHCSGRARPWRPGHKNAAGELQEPSGRRWGKPPAAHQQAWRVLLRPLLDRVSQRHVGREGHWRLQPLARGGAGAVLLEPALDGRAVVPAPGGWWVGGGGQGPESAVQAGSSAHVLKAACAHTRPLCRPPACRDAACPPSPTTHDWPVGSMTGSRMMCMLMGQKKWRGAPASSASASRSASFSLSLSSSSESSAGRAAGEGCGVWSEHAPCNCWCGSLWRRQRGRRRLQRHPAIPCRCKAGRRPARPTCAGQLGLAAGRGNPGPQLGVLPRPHRTDRGRLLLLLPGCEVGGVEAHLRQPGRGQRCVPARPPQQVLIERLLLSCGRVRQGSVGCARVLLQPQGQAAPATVPGRSFFTGAAQRNHARGSPLAATTDLKPPWRVQRSAASF